jgi:hypothetical protein
LKGKKIQLWEWVHLSLANTSTGELTIKISTPKRRIEETLSIFHCAPDSFTLSPILLIVDSTVPEPRELKDSSR